MLRKGGKRNASATGPVTTSAVVRMPRGIYCWKGPRQTGAAVDYALDVAATQQSPQVELDPVQATATAVSFGLSARRVTAAESPGLSE